ncbi:helix-turn-helix transcriptional regulator [Candidatus Viadribacter manganicus]|uniref:Helix-turn-helix transcriptional regulator n=1 Tax=Candidatus Viadribacter manganicus TaxID=1759059 RepID=A0A1B1AF55_9PROT|nr:response regulator transcription factor [Candidatus Viadribacter manganicus]ANP45206.1 helix-turn-helix transcriptional regulator [Candidatus Viadribacter manganicus]
MKRVVILYALGLAAGAFLLQWLQYNYLVRAFPSEIYIGLIAAAFAGLGVWAGMRLARRPNPATFEKNTAAIASLGITPREQEVLALLAAGKSNKEIASKLGVSPNTVKTQIASLYQKLEVQRRTQAVQKARELALIP